MVGTPDSGPCGLRGYTLPLSPSGDSALIAPPPWHFSGEFIWIDYRVDPDRAAAFLPPGMRLGPEPGQASAAFSTWQWCTKSGAELTDPARCQFAEFLLLLGAVHEGEPVARAPYAWVDRVVPLIRGWIQGMPKRLGSVHLSRVIQAGCAGPRLAPGGTFAASLAADDERLVEAGVSLTGRAASPPALCTVPLVHTRVFPSWDPAGAPLTELVASRVADVEYSAVWSGTATLDVTPAFLADPDLAALAPVCVGNGYVFGYGETLLGGTRLAEPWQAGQENR